MNIKGVLKHIFPLPAINSNRAEQRLSSEINALKKKMFALQSELQSQREWISKAVKNSSESVWASIFHDSIQGCPWLKDKAFWPGRAALGYQAMYVVYRILNELKPKRILELGLGQSTKLISLYAADSSQGVEHTVVESNKDWINFFSKEQVLPINTKISLLDCGFVPYKGENVRVFNGFRQTFSNRKFDFILVDAPLGADMKMHSRIDILGIIPNCLEKDFVILIDDTDRKGEQNTIAEISRILEQNSISHVEGCYEGLKSSTVICSSKLGFITTL